MILVEDEEFMNLDSRFLHQAMPGRADETIQYLRPTQQITAGRNQGLKEFDGIAIRLPLFFPTDVSRCGLFCLCLRCCNCFVVLSKTGVPFENGIALTRKNVGEGDWDAFAESWIP
jgi:hypothetical protein